MDRWQQMRANQNKYKLMKKLLTTSNDELMKNDKYHEENILKIKFRLSEARKMAHVT